MNATLVACAAAGVLILPLLKEPQWREARSPGAGCWPPACEPGEVPLAQPLLAHDGRLWMIGDGAAPGRIYQSTDGRTWLAAAHDAAWGARYGAADASYRGALWRVGGFVEDGATRTLMNDVWRSDDGRRWERVLAHAPWAPRARAHLVAFRDTLWLLGGEAGDSLLWLTTDGRSWWPRIGVALPTGNPQGVLVHRDALWIVGRGVWETATNDVWRSTDGMRWTRAVEVTEWEARTAAGFGVMRDRLWVIGGAGHRDVWSSPDGRHWTRHAADMPGPPRAADHSVVFDDGLWVIGGKTGGLGGTGFWDGVWYLR